MANDIDKEARKRLNELKGKLSKKLQEPSSTPKKPPATKASAKPAPKAAAEQAKPPKMPQKSQKRMNPSSGPGELNTNPSRPASTGKIPKVAEEETVAPKAPKAKAAKAPKIENSNPARHRELLKEFSAKPDISEEFMDLPGRPSMGHMAEDLGAAGGKAMKIAAEEAPTAAEHGAMRMMKLKALAKPSLGKTLGVGLAGGIAGLGLQALMESLDAAEAGDPDDPIENPPHLSKKENAEALRLSDKAANRQAMELAKQGKLKSPQKHKDLYDIKAYGEKGPSEQEEMEDRYAEELKKNPG